MNVIGTRQNIQTHLYCKKMKVSLNHGKLEKSLKRLIVYTTSHPENKYPRSALMQWRKQLVSLYSVYLFEPFQDALKSVELVEAIYPIARYKTELMRTKAISLGTQHKYRWLKWTQNHGPGAMFPIDWHMCLHI